MNNASSEDLTGSPRELRHRVAADPTSLVAARGVLGEWAAGVGMTVEQQEDLVLATYEAMANSAEHAYGAAGAQNVIDIHAHRGAASVTVVVTDYGRWLTPQPSNGLRGRGLPMIDGLTTHHEVTTADSGTTVTMTWSLTDS